MSAFLSIFITQVVPFLITNGPNLIKAGFNVAEYIGWVKDTDAKGATDADIDKLKAELHRWDDQINNPSTQPAG